MEQGAWAWTGERRCVSCHTNGSYMVVRPLLTAQLGKPHEEMREFFVSTLHQGWLNEQQGDPLEEQVNRLMRYLRAEGKLQGDLIERHCFGRPQSFRACWIRKESRI